MEGDAMSAPKKRKTKAQREAEQWGALRQRVSDVVTGACGRELDVDDEGEALESPSPEELERIVPALERLFGVNEEAKRNLYLFKVHNLGHYRDVDAITNHLFEAGVRA